MKKTVKILIAVLTLTLVIGALLAVSAGATEEGKTPKIISQNVYYDDVFSLMYAVSADSVNEGPVTLNIYYEYPDSNSEIKHTYTANSAETIQINGVDTSAFVTRDELSNIINELKEGLKREQSVPTTEPNTKYSGKR